MVKLVFLCRRRPDITHERYAALLLDEHVPLALRHHPRMRRYVVNVVEEVGADAPELDSVGMLWFDSLADYRERLYDSPEGARVIGHDVARFLGGADAYATREEVVEPSRGPARDKALLCLRRLPGATAAAFRACWLARVTGLAGGRGYVASLVEERLAATDLDYDGIAEVEGPLALAVGAHHDVAGVVHAYRVRRHVARW